MAITDDPGHETIGGAYSNTTGAKFNPAAVWIGANRPGSWQPPQYRQTYGNYTAPFPSLGQQVGQSLYGSIQAQPYTPAWYQSVLPPHPSSTQVIDRANYNWMLGQVGDPVHGGFTARPAASRQMQIGTPYVMNGRVPQDQRNIGYVSQAGNPFIGAYAGLTGYPGSGGGNTKPTGTSNPGGVKNPGGVLSPGQPSNPAGIKNPAGVTLSPGQVGSKNPNNLTLSMPQQQPQSGGGLFGQLQSMGITPQMMQGLLGGYMR